MLGWNSYSLSVFGGDTLLSSVVQQTFSVKGQTVSILGFVGRRLWLQLLSSPVVVKPQPDTTCKQLGAAVSSPAVQK